MFKNTAQKIAETTLRKTAKVVGSYLAHTDAKAEKKEETSPSNVVWGQGNYQELTNVLNRKTSLIDALYPETKNTAFTI